MTLVDSFGRKANSLRIALTPRCNLSCTYCHHEGEVFPEKEMPASVVIKITKAAAELGFRSIKFTGGEPLLRNDLEEIISQMPSDLDISITTNGIFLEEKARSLAEAGLDRVNVSLDSLDPEIYRSITGCREGDLDRVLRGIDAAIDAGLKPIKLNVVVLKENEEGIKDLIEFSKKKGLILQLIELLDVEHARVAGDIEGIERYLRDRADRVEVREMHRRKKYYVQGAEVEVVRPMDNTEFCANCTRLRVTSDGKLKPCLLRNDNLINITKCDVEEMKELFRIANSRRAPYFTKGRSDRVGGCATLGASSR
jgi:cyclic pyranopterin phosphate synthase